MSSVKMRGIILLLTICIIVGIVSSQITFSRDWTGGKRAAPQLAVDCGQFSRVCRRFIHELKQAMSSEISGREHRRPDDSSAIYDDEK